MGLPGQSVWQIVRLLGHYNVVPAAAIRATFSETHTRRQPHRKHSRVDIQKLGTSIGIDPERLQSDSTVEGLLGEDPVATQLIHPQVRLCARCAAVGYHALLFQVRFLKRCPVHGSRLGDTPIPFTRHETKDQGAALWMDLLPVPPELRGSHFRRRQFLAIASRMAEFSHEIRHLAISDGMITRTYFPPASSDERAGAFDARQLTKVAWVSSIRSRRGNAMRGPLSIRTSESPAAALPSDCLPDIICRAYTGVHSEIRSENDKVLKRAMFEHWGKGSSNPEVFRSRMNSDLGWITLSAYCEWRTFWEGHQKDLRRFFDPEGRPSLKDTLLDRFLSRFGARMGRNFLCSHWVAQTFFREVFRCTYRESLANMLAKRDEAGVFSSSLGMTVPLCCHVQQNDHETLVFVNIRPISEPSPDRPVHQKVARAAAL